MNARAALLAGALMVVVPARAAAQSDDRHRETLENLQKELDGEHAKLSTSDCTEACRALGSIRRAADKICALDPGTTRCSSAQAKADDATRRVREACPECVIAALPHREAPPPAAPASAPAEYRAEKRGGCAGCATAPTRDVDLAWILAAAWVVSRATKKSRRRL
jgi:hypothetical protein